MPGKSLRWSITTPEQRKKFINQLADTFIELHKFPFDLLGCLNRPGDSHVGAFARESLTDFQGSFMQATGPFSSLEEYHVASLRLILDLILRDEMHTQQAVDAYLIHRFLLDLVPAVLPQTTRDDQKYYLKHADEKEDQILVDEAFNIASLIGNGLIPHRKLLHSTLQLFFCQLETFTMELITSAMMK